MTLRRPLAFLATLLACGLLLVTFISQRGRGPVVVRRIVDPIVRSVGTQGFVNVLDYGAVGDGVTDNWAALQNIVDNVAAERATIYFPAGDYLISQTISCGARAFNFRGDGRPQPYNVWMGGSMIRGQFAGPLLQSFYPAGNLSIEDMGFANRDTTAGRGLLLSGANVALLRVSVYAHKAIEMEPNAFTTSMQQIVVRAPPAWPVGSVGIAIRGHALLHGADIVGFDVGLRVSGVGNDMRSMRVEVNRTGIELGVTPEGTNWALTASTLESVSMEANDYGIVARNVTSCSVRNVLIQGTANSPSVGSKAGLIVSHSQWVHYEQVFTSNTFSEGAIRVLSSVPTTRPVRFTLCNAGNLHATAPKWDLARPPDANLVLEQCS